MTGGGCAAYSDSAADANTNSDAQLHADIYAMRRRQLHSHADSDCYGNSRITPTATATAHLQQPLRLRLPPPLQQRCGIAAAYTDTKASADTAGACGRLLLFR